MEAEIYIKNFVYWSDVRYLIMINLMNPIYPWGGLEDETDLGIPCILNITHVHCYRNSLDPDM